MGGVFGEQTALSGHGGGRFTMGRWIKRVEPVGQYAHRWQPVADRFTVSVDVDAVGQSTHDEHVGAQGFEIGRETGDEVVAVGGGMAGGGDPEDAPGGGGCRSL